ncbi:MAG TPA: hypothetical protein VLA61_05840 [Ideonella sp.]|uniref:hypothetical protein n=1 Tax=Ideonella sp. TaxID=1929293 RepID=UPI002C90371C|nr:hypothetical protein [Ideonella sp.]HSI47768.1 hypothetical protein [Ideonella sp.]
MNANRRSRVVASHGLTEADASALQIFLNFSQHSTRDAWSLGTLGEADLLLQPLGEPLPVLAMPVTIVWVGEMQAGMPAGSRYALARPLQLDQVLALLLHVERREEAEARESGELQAGLAAASQPVPAEPPREASLEETAPLPRLAPAGESSDAALIFRLNRWPSAASLTSHRYLPRLASLLTTRSLSVFELSRLSNVAEDECSAFLEDMASEGILDTQFPSEVPSELPSGFDAEAPTRPTSAAGSSGLVNQLRSMLRLG